MGLVTKDVYPEFDRLMTGLEDWYSDSMRARAYDADQGHGASKPGHVVLHVNKYPGPPWRRLWYEADGDPVAQQAIIAALKEEHFGLLHGPSQSGPASGLHRGTQDWKRAIATAEGSLREVGRRYGVSHTEVRRIRLEQRRVPAR